MTHARKLTIAALIGAALILASALPASAWSAFSITGSVSCDRQSNTQTATVTAHNPEGQTGTVRQSTGPVFGVGTTVAAHANRTETFTKPGSFAGNVTVTISVNYPGDGAYRQSSVTLHFPGGCTPPTPPTTSTTSTVVQSTTTTAPGSTTTAGLIPPTVVTAPPAVSVPTAPAFTG